MIPDRISLPQNPQILVITLRRLGDVLLSTPLIRSIRTAWPDAHIDALVFADTIGILEGNPDLNRIIAMPSPPTAGQTLALARDLFRQYDLAVSTQSGDRPTSFAILAGAKRVAPVEHRFGGRIKALLLSRQLVQERSLHRVEATLRIADALGIARRAEVVPPGAVHPPMLPVGDYAVMHAAPFFNYKRWSADGWREVANGLVARGFTVIATGGPAASEGSYLDGVWAGTTVRRLEGQLTWRELTGLLQRARIYVGPDTSVTHLAAATGCPTVALYGPTDPRLWGPWPARGLTESWEAMAYCQRRGNVWILQHPFPCTPCQLEGCGRNIESASECLLQLGPDAVLRAVDEALGS